MSRQYKMNQEIEAKFLNVDHDDIRQKLESLGAKLVHQKRQMRRVMLDFPDERFRKNDQHERFRIRDEGDKVTVTYKKSVEGSNYPIEHEFETNSFDETRQVFKSLGFIEYSYQETRREVWSYKKAFIMLDEWPWVKPFIEIEGEDEITIREVTKDLGLEWEDAMFGPADTVYMIEYKQMKQRDSVGYVEKLVFEGEMPEYLKDRI